MLNRNILLYILFFILFKSTFSFIQLPKSLQGLNNKKHHPDYEPPKVKTYDNDGRHPSYFNFQTFTGLESKIAERNQDKQNDQAMSQQIKFNLLKQQDLRNKQAMDNEKENIWQFNQQMKSGLINKDTKKQNNNQEQGQNPSQQRNSDSNYKQSPLNEPTQMKPEESNKDKSQINMEKWQSGFLGIDEKFESLQQRSLPYYINKNSNRKVMKKSPKRTIQKIIKGQQRRKYMNHPSHRYFTTVSTTTLITRMEQTLPTIRKMVRSSRYNKVSRYPMPFHNLAPMRPGKKGKRKNLSGIDTGPIDDMDDLFYKTRKNSM